MSKQLRFSKAGEKFLNKIAEARGHLIYDDMVQMIPSYDVPYFVQILDETAEDWDVTNELFQYFSKQILLGLKEDNSLDEYSRLVSEDSREMINKMMKLKL